MHIQVLRSHVNPFTANTKSYSASSVVQKNEYLCMQKKQQNILIIREFLSSGNTDQVRLFK